MSAGETPPRAAQLEKAGTAMSEREALYVAISSKPAVKRAVRLVWIRDLLYSKPRTVAELAAICGVTERTIYTDLTDLQAEPIYAPLVVNVQWGRSSEA